VHLKKVCHDIVTFFSFSYDLNNSYDTRNWLLDSSEQRDNANKLFTDRYEETEVATRLLTSYDATMIV